MSAPVENIKTFANTLTGKFIYHWILLCIVIPAITISFNITRYADLVLVFPLIVICYCGTRLAIIAARGSNRIVEMTFWLYTYVFMGMYACLQIEVGQFPWRGHYSNGLIAGAQILIIIGLVAFDIGRHVRIYRRKSSVAVITTRFEISRAQLYLTAVIGIGLAIYATMKLGAFSTLFLNRTERFALISSRFNVAELSVYGSLAKTIVYVLLIVTLAYKIYDRKSNKPIYFLIFILFIFTTIENNPIATPRFQVGTILLGLYFIFPWNKHKAIIAIYGLLLGLIIIFPFADLFRASNHPSLEVSIESHGSMNQIAKNPDYDSFQQVMNGMRMVQRDGFQYGRQITGALLFWVPRSMWPQKAEPTGVLIAEKNGYLFTNLSAPLWIEFYVDGGWLLVIPGFIFYGAFVRWADDVRRKRAGRATPAYLLVTIYAGYQIFLLRGSLMPAIAYLAPVVPIVLACGKWRRYRTTDQVSAHENQIMP